jgi:hypothetical protein
LSAKAKEGIAGLRTIGKEADSLMKAMEGSEVGSDLAVEPSELEPR